jgi:hypothetical protein
MLRVHRKITGGVVAFEQIVLRIHDVWHIIAQQAIDPVRKRFGRWACLCMRCGEKAIGLKACALRAKGLDANTGV